MLSLIFYNNMLTRLTLSSFHFNKFRRQTHRFSISVSLRKMLIKVLPALQDNFMYLLIDKNTNEAAVVDPVEPNKVVDAVKEHQVNLTTALTTHHHWDHAGGNEELKKLIPGIKVCGGDQRVTGLTDKVSHKDILNIGEITIECLATPGHTSSHICYYVTQKGSTPVVFTGDTLFSAGCGRLFEGTPEQMNKSLNETLGSLPPETQVYCGHEYTKDNLKFGLHVEPNNKDAKERLEWVCDRLKNNLPTVPSTIQDEKKFNPFMRVCEQTLKDHTNETEPAKVLGKIRNEKNMFKS